MYKLLRISAIAFLGFASLQVNAQTLYNAGKLDGSNSTKTHVQRMVQGGMDQNVMIGSFSDSLHLDIITSSFTLMGGGAGIKDGFIASYGSTAYLNFAIKIGGATTADSVIIRSVYVDALNYIYIGGTLYGTADFDGFAGVTNASATTGGDAFFARYDGTGNLQWVSILNTTGSNAGVNSICLSGGGGYLYVAGYFDGDMDTDPSAGVATTTAAGGTDGFIGQYDYSSGTLISCVMFTGSGNETIQSIFSDYSDNVIFVGNFDTDVDADPSVGASTVYTSAGGWDIYHGILNSSLAYAGSIQLGGASNEMAVDIYNDGNYPVILADFNGTFDMNPLNPGIDIATTAGNYDCAFLRYDPGFNLTWGKTFGNSGVNHGNMIRGELGSMPSHSSYYMYMFTMNFTGTMDVDPNATVVNITSSNTPVNAVAITIDDMGNYFTHFTNQAQTISGVSINSNSHNDFTVAGDFKGTAVDIAPTTIVSAQTHSVNYAGYYVYYNRCALTATITLDAPYECGTSTASLTANPTGGFGIIAYYWNTYESVANITGHTDGYYNCDITDDFGCEVIPTLTIGHDSIPALGASITPVQTTCGNNYGSASAVEVNAAGPVSFLWSNGDTTNVADSLAAGFYTLQVKDTTGCFVVEAFDISDSDGPNVSLVSSTDIACAGALTGAVDVTVTGGAAPVTFAWSNGATTEDLTGVPPGSYALIATDAAGCVGQICVNVSAPTAMSIYLNNYTSSNCGFSDGSLAITPQGGTPPYTIQWDAGAGFSTNDTVINLHAGIYNVLITDSAGCTYNENYGVGDYGTWPFIYTNTIIDPSCAYGAGSIDVDVFDYGGGSTYLWSNGSATQDISGLAGGKYVLLAYDLITGCTTSYTALLTNVPPNIPTVCMVTVDSTDTQNVVVYDKTTTPEAAYYKIYREGFCGSVGFTHVGSVDRDSLSVFYDTVVNSDTRSWKYYVTAVDTCGNESAPSAIHKTIHLDIAFNSNFDVVCNWEAYEGQPINGYTIYRVDPTHTVFDSIRSVGNTTLAWIDTTNFTPWGSQIEYFVEAQPVSACFASRAFNQNSSRSNNAKAFVVADTLSSGLQVQEINLQEVVKIYPNPANDRVNIRIEGGSGDFRIEMIDQVGQRVRTFDLLNGQSSVSTRDLLSGVYFVKVTSIKTRANKTFKLVISR